MRALYRVKNKHGNITGFILDNNEYINYYGVAKNVGYIDISGKSAARIMINMSLISWLSGRMM